MDKRIKRSLERAIDELIMAGVDYGRFDCPRNSVIKHITIDEAKARLLAVIHSYAFRSALDVRSAMLSAPKE